MLRGGSEWMVMAVAVAMCCWLLLVHLFRRQEHGSLGGVDELGLCE